MDKATETSIGKCSFPADTLAPMRVPALAFFVFSLPVVGADPYQRIRHPDLQVEEVKGQRIEEKLSLEGKLRVTSEKPLHGLVITFDFLDLRNAVLSSQNDEISDDIVKPGESPAFHAETANPPRAIKFKMRAFDGSQQELKLAGAGPYLIE